MRWERYALIAILAIQLVIVGWLVIVDRNIRSFRKSTETLAISSQPTNLPAGPGNAPGIMAPPGQPVLPMGLGGPGQPGWPGAPGDAFPLPDFLRFDTKTDARAKALTLSRIDSWIYQQLPKSPRTLPNIILIINEALSVKYLGFSGGDIAHTPNIDAFAKTGVSFPHAISQGSWTSPSMRAILTGVYPNQAGFFDEGVSPSLDPMTARLPPSVITLAELLRSKGYFCAALIGSNFRFFEVILRGFSYIERFLSTDPDPHAVFSAAMSLIEQSTDQPYFLLVHVYPPHEPYHVKIQPNYSRAFSDTELNAIRRGMVTGKTELSKASQATYIRAVEELDEQYGRFFRFLARSNSNRFSADRDIVIFTADHGEEFEHEHGYVRHGLSLYQEVIGVPLIFKIPDTRPRVIGDYVENASIVPTLLEKLGLQDPRPSHWVTPKSLIDMITKEEPPNKSSYALSEGVLKIFEVPGARELKSIVRNDGKKIIYDTETKTSKFFDLASDPTESKNLSGKKDARPIINELFAEISKRTNPNADYAPLAGKFLDHVVPSGNLPGSGGPGSGGSPTPSDPKQGGVQP